MNDTVLIVDDSLTVRMDLAESFAAAGYRSLPCATAAEARAALAREPVAVVVLDVILPDGDGVELLKEVRALPAGDRIAVVLLSIEAEVKDRIRGLRTGADEYVGKPYDAGYLVAKVSELVGARRPSPFADLPAILVIDDSATFRGELRAALEASGYQVTTAASGEEGLRLAGARRPSAVIVDGVLPGIDGATVIRRVRLDAALRDVPCLLLTASDDAGAELRALDAGADAFVRKEDDLPVILAKLAAVLRRAAAGRPLDETQSQLGPKRILAVDDSVTYVQELAVALRAEGYDVILARSGEEALELLAIQPVDCVLLDLMMPGLGGEETCRRIKAAPTTRDVPLIMLTALDDRAAMLQGLSAGADDYIQKSSDLEILKARLRAQIRRKQFEDENRRIREELLRSEIEAAEARSARALAEARAGVVEELETRVRERTSDLARANAALRQEIEERKRAEQALRESEESLATTLDSIGDAVIATDVGGRVVRMNPVAVHLTGWPLHEARGRQLVEVLRTYDERTGQPAEDLATRVLRNGWVAGHGGNTLLRARDGSSRPISEMGSPIRGADDHVEGVVLVFRDQTEERRTEQVRAKSRELEAQNLRIQEASRLKGEFLANMSHELRTPLNAIIGFAELIHQREVEPDTPQHHEFMGHILASGRHLLQLINDILDLSKVESGKLQFWPEPLNLTMLIEEVLGILRTTIASKKIRVESQVDPAAAEVVLDASRFKQVLYNYISNALKFTPQDGRVTIRVLPAEAASFRLEVEDTGIGIAPEDLGRLFIEFEQLDTGAAKTHSGTGLGLALTKRLVEAQGGSVGVRSTRGEGSTFHATLPREAVPVAGMPGPRHYARVDPHAPAVLVIEDDPGDQATLVKVLTKAGYAVEAATTGAQALAKSRARAFDAITLDLLLPDMSGLEVLRAIRAEGRNREVPVIVITVVTDAGAVAGFAIDDFLGKPLDGAVLLASLRRARIRPEQPGTVLVVDDDPAALTLMSATLAPLGYRVTCAAGGEEGLRAAREVAPVGLVLDLLMPGMDGFAFLEHFRQLPGCALTPVIVWTIKDLAAGEWARLRASAQAVVAKGGPDGAAVVHELETFLAMKKARPEEETH